MAIKEQTQPTDSLISRVRARLLSQEIVLLVIMIVALLLLSTRTDRFLTLDNLLNQGRLLTELGLMALPMTFIIITGGIDLSVGSIFGLSAIVMGFTWQNNGLPLGLAIILCVGVGTLAGFINGFFIVRVGLPPLIMTLATLALYRGIALGISQARSANNFPDWFFQMGQGEVLGVPTQLWLFVVFAIVVAIILSRTPFGRSLYMIGYNELASRFSGVSVDRYKLIIYTFSGFMAGLAGYIYTSRVSGTRADMGSGMELNVIAAVVLGGTSILGGSGSIAGTVIGLILIQLLQNGLSLAGVKGDATVIVIGSVLILAILVNGFIQRRSDSS